jgi:RNA polymerase sigma-70 factor (ECF subfamily)
MSPKSSQSANAPRMSDAAALSALAQGQIDALGYLYDRYSAAVHAFVCRATNDAHDVDDLVQATFLVAAKTAGQSDGKQNCRSWLVGIAARILYRRQRGMSRWARALRELTFREAGAYADPHRVLSARDEVQRLSSALSQLSEPKRVVLLLAEAEEQSSEEISRALQVPIGTVWTRLHHARRDLRRLLEREAER